MVILYNSDVGDINNHTKSKVAGNIGYSLIPGGTSVLGGWSLGLNRYGKHQEDAERFLLWACIPSEIMRVINGEISDNEALENMERRIVQLLEDKEKS